MPLLLDILITSVPITVLSLRTVLLLPIKTEASST